ncbi:MULTISPECIES: fibronectin type III domain-containing protein [Olivibacter]|uniref:Fibronectin type III domain-containing protein n=1 Tax=Olivibacter jilunii TaxID=985016 RepID=A0ABW6AXS3_9SPHI|nr:fibronectin type III domain-containing protein [Olivibacter sp. UJ_SKK_5.1]MDX3912090.1 fibronectin type III domain-containing protein [Pseudosphingobacterium sp.]
MDNNLNRKMMRNLRVNSSFKSKRDAEILQNALTILQAMTSNTNFPEPSPSLTEVQDAVTDYQEKLAKASQKGSPLDVSIKNESKEGLGSVLKRLAFYVNSVAEGNMPMLLSSGFSLSAQPIAGLIPPIPTRLRLTDGPLSGQIRFDFDKIAGRVIYEYSNAKERDESGMFVWSDRKTTTSTRNILSGLQPGTTYYVRVRAVNSNGPGDWCEPVSLMAR